MNDRIADAGIVCVTEAGDDLEKEWPLIERSRLDARRGGLGDDVMYGKCPLTVGLWQKHRMHISKQVPRS